MTHSRKIKKHINLNYSFSIYKETIRTLLTLKSAVILSRQIESWVWDCARLTEAGIGTPHFIELHRYCIF